MNESQNNKLNEGSQASLTNKYILYGSIYKPRKYKLIYSDKKYINSYLGIRMETRKGGRKTL